MAGRTRSGVFPIKVPSTSFFAHLAEGTVQTAYIPWRVTNWGLSDDSNSKSQSNLQTDKELGVSESNDYANAHDGECSSSESSLNPTVYSFRGSDFDRSEE